MNKMVVQNYWKIFNWFLTLSSDTCLLIFGILLAILLRCCTMLHPYSGQGKPPMYGDYEAQRHWMEVTTNLPIYDWYRNTTDNDLMYWGLDYPPLTAYHMYFLGKVASVINENFTKLHESRGYESENHKVFMRYSVLICDILIFFPSIILYFKLCARPATKKSESGHVKSIPQAKHFNEWAPMDTTLCTILALIYPGLILIDHGHFQYNCVSLGFAILATVLLLNKLNIWTTVVFLLGLNYKQMELYHALPFFMYLLSTCIPRPAEKWIWGFFRLVMLAFTTILTFNIIWLPFLIYWEQEAPLHVLKRIFPVDRGLYEDYVSNYWSTIHRVLFKSTDNKKILGLSAMTTILASLPSCLDIFLRPNLRKFVPALINVSLSFYLFSYQVHEKSILLVAIPVILYLPFAPIVCFWFLCISTYSLLPLFLKDNLIIAFVALMLFYAMIFRVSVIYAFKKNLNVNIYKEYYEILSENILKVDAKNYQKSNYWLVIVFMQMIENRKIFIQILLHVVMVLSLAGSLGLFIITLSFNPPQRYPDLWTLLISLHCFLHFVGFWLYFNIKQFFIPPHLEGVVANVKDKEYLKNVKKNE